jgi:hypothetical protein
MPISPSELFHLRLEAEAGTAERTARARSAYSS